MCEVKQRAAFIYFSVGAFSQAEALFLESGCDPREVGCAHCRLILHDCHMTVTWQSHYISWGWICIQTTWHYSGDYAKNVLLFSAGDCTIWGYPPSWLFLHDTGVFVAWNPISRNVRYVCQSRFSMCVQVADVGCSGDNTQEQIQWGL